MAGATAAEKLVVRLQQQSEEKGNPNKKSLEEKVKRKLEKNSVTMAMGGSGDPCPVPDYVRVILVTDLSGRKRKMYIPAALDLDRPKRPRISFSPEQLKVLEMEFEQNHFVAEGRREIMAKALGLTETQIKVWFQNRRTKLRRQEPMTTSVAVPTPASPPDRTTPLNFPFSFPQINLTYPVQFPEAFAMRSHCLQLHRRS